MVFIATVWTPVILGSTGERNVTRKAFCLRATLVKVVSHNITNESIELAYIQGFGGRHRAEHYREHIFQEPDICSNIFINDGASLNLNFSSCMM